jgi:hypothetical protein
MQVINAVVIITQNLTYRVKIYFIAILRVQMSEHELWVGNESLYRGLVFMLRLQ